MIDLKDKIFELPWPPSVNHYWMLISTGKGGRKVLGKKGRDFREQVIEQLKGSVPLEGRLSIKIIATPPDKRRRDLDNILKPTLDALEHAGVYSDDNQIDEIHICRSEPNKPGKLVIFLTNLED